MRKYEGLHLSSEPLSAKWLESLDCTLIVTDHSLVDWNLVASHSKLVVDPRNACGKCTGPRTHIIS
jgi:UDP-N-acetyl-D-glucosamine dehydrogenase